MGACSSVRMFTVKRPDCSKAWWLPVVFSIQMSTRGGSSETEQNAETVIPNVFPVASFVVTTVTPLANLDRAARKSAEETGISSSENLPHRTHCFKTVREID